MYLQWFDMIDKYEIQNKYKVLWFVMRDKYEIQDSWNQDEHPDPVVCVLNKNRE